ncbi:hypothetical protein [Campylobacter pinnipediorum]|uniref:Tetratricopeptide repeat lipoprotein n=1 Tax=Campylobacter pinnipediorum subsp. pinnipediorum TaxID=1660067 RepID=A0AAX0LCK2_9BACT|nr:hypothetical protein [Campylobacter pinnipediorum]AQW81559.1 hypothetical protein CPIN17260_1274 [Campylobacter pinnipediorum subsp. pinnipediorum]AQW83187.1 hypothetical protein CPIN17261_1187 [Campylobacter pinnipediorum subsp. pinnipediorum]AQW84755.1 hypothetical protein CPIN17262_1079 [Campylobacter pinnipediorum subsp. pinnipediorum]OPA79619.1 hypothetical protein BFG05_00490 [Campylobacter pinnipediorum subsp. pinnipediorum]OPA81778.1 hypothetical protein BFG04_01150 [Campylobacter p
MYRNKIIFFLSFLIFLINNLNAKDINLEILKALEFTNNGNYDLAIAVYDDLYKQTKDSEFLKEELKLAVSFSDDKIDEIMSRADEKLKKDPFYIRLLSTKKIRKGDLVGAKKLLNELLKTDKDAKNYLMLGDIALFEKDEKTALVNFQKAYDLDQSEDNLLKLTMLDESSKSFELLKDYKDQNGCSLSVCSKLANMYLENKEYIKLSGIYTELFEATGDYKFKELSLGILLFSKNNDQAIELLKNGDFDNNTTIDVYASMKRYKDAYDVAKNAYDDTKDIFYLSMMAIFEYEKYDSKPDKATLNNIISNFEKSAVKLNNPIFLNYYGYLMIDHDVDYKKGISLVKKALKIDPKSSAYLDSLAWGYFKINECKKAKEIMDKVLKDEDFAKQDEAILHSKEIDKCLKN